MPMELKQKTVIIATEVFARAALAPSNPVVEIVETRFGEVHVFV